MRPCIVMKNRLGKVRPCVGGELCEQCPVPPSIGYVWDGKKWRQDYATESWSQAAERICREALEEELP